MRGRAIGPSLGFLASICFGVSDFAGGRVAVRNAEVASSSLAPSTTFLLILPSVLRAHEAMAPVRRAFVTTKLPRSSAATVNSCAGCT
jgi:hypothetical protein